MSRVRIRNFGPVDNSNDITHRMNGFLEQSHIKYVGHTYSVTPNTEANLSKFKEGFKKFRENWFVGSIAYFVKEEKGEEKKRKD